MGKGGGRRAKSKILKKNYIQMYIHNNNNFYGCAKKKNTTIDT